MIPINKTTPPPSLTAYKQQADACYDGPHFTDVKADIRATLLNEQGYLCAYCMQRLHNDRFRMKIEHYRCQENYAEEQLDYKNMLAVCCGNSGQTAARQHCDTRKGNRDLSCHPGDAQSGLAHKISYRGDGLIYSRDQRFDQDINEVLNLNYARLRENRNAVLKALLIYLDRLPGSATSARLVGLLKLWQSPDAEGKKREFCGIAIYYLSRKIRKAQRLR